MLSLQRKENGGVAVKLFYETLYRYGRAPWDVGPREELVRLVQTGRLRPGRALDLGSGTGSNCVFLAEHGFDVTGLDYAASAVELGQARARQAGVQVHFVQDDLTRLRRVTGVFDLLVDYGTLDDLVPRHRDRYLENILSLTRPGTEFLLFCFEWPLRGWERAMIRLGVFGAMALEPGEAQQRFEPFFEMERIAETRNERGWPRATATYLMARKGAPNNVGA
jgi:cyclopropane fatty-acyl-phospholipid synthase-like methyltransferase